MRDVLGWEDLEDFVADQLSSEMVFTKQSWEALVKDGQAFYSNEIERHIVLVKLMTIETMYREFCELVWEEGFSRDEYLQWLGDEDFFCSIRIWQILGEDFYRDEKIEGYGLIEESGSRFGYKDLLIAGLDNLIDFYRNEVYEALKHYFGGDAKLFIAMNATRYRREDGTEYNVKEFTSEDWHAFGLDEDKLNFDYEEERGFCWVSNGMPRFPRKNGY